MTKQNSRMRWALIVPALIIPLLASFFYFIWFPGTAFGNSFYLGVKVFALTWPFVAVWWLLKEKFFDGAVWAKAGDSVMINEKQDSRPSKHKRGIIEGTIFGVLTFTLLVAIVKLTPMGDILEGNEPLIREKVEGFGVNTPLLFILFAIFISFIHSGLEEFFWRVFCFGQLTKLVRVGLAVFIAAVGFSLHHIVVLTQYIPMHLAFIFGACVGLGGAVWSVIMYRNNSVWGIWVSHVIIDLAIMWVGYELLF